jgi:hypothetical protein
VRVQPVAAGPEDHPTAPVGVTLGLGCLKEQAPDHLAVDLRREHAG